MKSTTKPAAARPPRVFPPLHALAVSALRLVSQGKPTQAAKLSEAVQFIAHSSAFSNPTNN